MLLFRQINLSLREQIQLLFSTCSIEPFPQLTDPEISTKIQFLANWKIAKGVPCKVFDLVTVIPDSFTVWAECTRLVRWERTLSILLLGCVELTVAFRIDFGGTARLEPDVTYSTCPRRADTPNPGFSMGWNRVIPWTVETHSARKWSRKFSMLETASALSLKTTDD